MDSLEIESIIENVEVQSGTSTASSRFCPLQCVIRKPFLIVLSEHREEVRVGLIDQVDFEAINQNQEPDI